MGKWAKAAFERLKQREGKDHARIQKEVLERQQVLAEAPDLWSQLLDGITEEVDDFERLRPGLLEKNDDWGGSTPKLTVSTPVRMLTLTFNSDIPKISYSVLQVWSLNQRVRHHIERGHEQCHTGTADRIMHDAIGSDQLPAATDSICQL